jgi:hypothetical protein
MQSSFSFSKETTKNGFLNQLTISQHHMSLLSIDSGGGGPHTKKSSDVD